MDDRVERLCSLRHLVRVFPFLLMIFAGARLLERQALNEQRRLISSFYPLVVQKPRGDQVSKMSFA